MSERTSTRRAVLFGAATIGAAAAGAGAGSYAYLSDQSAADISINVGSLSLAKPAPIEWSEDPSTEGEDDFTDRISIENTGNLPARQVLLTDLTIHSNPDLATALEILDVRYGQESVSSILADVESNENGNGLFDLDDLRQRLDAVDVQLEDLAGPGTLHAGDTAYLEIDARWDYSKIPDERDGAELSASFTVRGRQDDPGED